MPDHVIVLPADPTVSHRIIEWPDGGTLPLLYGEIGCDCVDVATVRTPLGTISYWVDDEGLLANDIRHNDRGIYLMRSLGYNVDDIAGTMVITGGPDAVGDTLGLPARVVAILDAFLDELTAHCRTRVAPWN